MLDSHSCSCTSILFLTKCTCNGKDPISGVMVSVLDSSAVERGFQSQTGWLRIRMICLSGGTCLPADFCFSELAL